MMKWNKMYAFFLTGLAINLVGFLVFHDTIAFYNDTEKSSDNFWVMGDLDFSLNSPQIDFVSSEDTNELVPGESVTRDIYVKNDGSLSFKYSAHVEPIECASNVLDQLNLQIWYNYYQAEPGPSPNHLEHRIMEKKYDGLLVNFADFDTNLGEHDPELQLTNYHPYFNNMFYVPSEHWLYFKISLPANTSLREDYVCNFDFIFDAWQINYEEDQQVFHDSEKINNSLSIKGKEEEEEEEEKKITICHVTSSETNPWETISIPLPAWPAHEAHGDYLGECEDEAEPAPETYCELELTKSDNEVDPIAPGDNVTYHLSLTNIGTGDCTDVRLKDFFDLNTSYVSSSLDLDYDENEYLGWILGTMNPGDNQQVDLTMSVSEDAQCSSTLVNTAKFLSNETSWGDPVLEETTVMCEEVEE